MDRLSWCVPCLRGRHGRTCTGVRGVELVIAGVFAPPLLPGEGACGCPCDTLAPYAEHPPERGTAR